MAGIKLLTDMVVVARRAFEGSSSSLVRTLVDLTPFLSNLIAMLLGAWNVGAPLWVLTVRRDPEDDCVPVLRKHSDATKHAIGAIVIASERPADAL